MRVVPGTHDRTIHPATERCESGRGLGPMSTNVHGPPVQKRVSREFARQTALTHMDAICKDCRCGVHKAPYFGGRSDNLLGTESLSTPMGCGRKAAPPEGVTRASGEARRGRQMCAWGAEAERTHCCATFIHIHRDLDTTCPFGQVVSIWGETFLVSGGTPEGGC